MINREKKEASENEAAGSRVQESPKIDRSGRMCVCARMSRDNCAKQRKWKDSKHSNRKEMYLQVYFYFIYKRKVPKMANAVGAYSSFFKENNKYYGRKRKWKQSLKR